MVVLGGPNERAQVHYKTTPDDLRSVRQVYAAVHRSTSVLSMAAIARCSARHRAKRTNEMAMLVRVGKLVVSYL